MGLRELLFPAVEPVESRSVGPYFSIDDPALAEYLGISSRSLAGVEVSENRAMGVTAFYRAVTLIAGTIAGLPLKAYRKSGDTRDTVATFLDNPAGPYPLTPFSWVETVMLHQLVRGEAFLLHIVNGAGALIGLWPVHPASVDVKWSGVADKVFKVTMADGSTKEYTTAEMTHVMGPSLDGLRGMSPIAVHRNTIGIGLAGDTAAARAFGNGMLVAGLVSADEDVDEEEAKAIKAGLSAKLSGVENAGDIAFVNRKLKFTPWAMTAKDAQFIESREFSVIDVSRIFGIPPHLLGVTGAVSQFGTGVEEQNRGLARYTLMGWTSRLEQALTALLPRGTFAEFDYAGLLQGSPADEIKLLIEQVKGGLLTVDEARAIRNLPPLPKAEEPTPPPAPEPDPNEDPQEQPNV